MNKVSELKQHNVLNIQDILRAQDITRWNMVNTSRTQSLAEHTFNVVTIARSIANKLGMDDIKIMKYAFDHDLDEVNTGDIPSPTKEKLKIKDCYAGKNKSECSSREIAIVAIADLIEAVWFINTHGLGRHAAIVADNLIDRLNRRIALYASTDKALQDAVGETIGEIEHGDFISE